MKEPNRLKHFEKNDPQTDPLARNVRRDNQALRPHIDSILGDVSKVMSWEDIEEEEDAEFDKDNRDLSSGNTGHDMDDKH